MPAGNPAGYMSPEMQAQMLGRQTSVGGPFDFFGPSSAVEAGGPMTQPPRVNLSDEEILDLLQGVRSPQVMAERHGVTTGALLEQYPQFAPKPEPAAPDTGDPNRSGGLNLLRILTFGSPLQGEEGIRARP